MCLMDSVGKHYVSPFFSRIRVLAISAILSCFNFVRYIGSADDEGAAGNGHGGQGFIEEDKTPQGIKEDADISDEADHDGVGRGIGRWSSRSEPGRS